MGFRTQKPPQKFGVKSGLIQKRLKHGKKYFTLLYVLKYLFIPTNLAAIFFSFFSFFFFLNLVRYALLLNHKTSKSNFSVKLLSCKPNCSPEIFWNHSSGNPSKNCNSQNSIFGRQFFISVDI